MRKDEILQKNRQSNNDEGMEYAENQGRKIGFITFVILFIFITLFNLFLGEPIIFYATSPLFWAFIAGESYGKYCFEKKKVYLITTIAASISTILFVVKFVLATLG